MAFTTILLMFFIPVLAALLLVARYIYIITSKGVIPKRNSKPVRTMIVLGSGGHTAEMLMLVEQLSKESYSPRCYVVAATDAMSGTKAMRKEQEWCPSGDSSLPYTIKVIPRSREVGQSYVTSVYTTLYSLGASMHTVWLQQPELVLVNGPGTCIPICACAFLLRLLGLLQTRIVYIESIARVKRLSLSGKILYHSRVADIIFVQWEELQQLLPRTICAGRLY